MQVKVKQVGPKGGMVVNSAPWKARKKLATYTWVAMHDI